VTYRYHRPAPHRHHGISQHLRAERLGLTRWKRRALYISTLSIYLSISIWLSMSRSRTGTIGPPPTGIMGYPYIYFIHPSIHPSIHLFTCICLSMSRVPVPSSRPPPASWDIPASAGRAVRASATGRRRRRGLRYRGGV